MGLAAAASVRVGNALGAGKPQQAKLSCKVPVFCARKIGDTPRERHAQKDVCPGHANTSDY